ncbi:MAG: phage integrase SAM-like domain-containing protein, partial [Blastocatellia bacterium]|nr:phage integrase SAM-like domain-containing protein [Blastocatellia bacterium]
MDEAKTMDLQTTIFKRKTGRHKGKWVLEVKYWDDVQGKQRVAVRMFSYQSEAKDARPQLEKDLRSTHGQIQTGRKITFADLCVVAKADFYREAVIEQGRKIAGVKSSSTASFLKVLKEFFGDRKLGSITSGDLTSYKIWRFKRGDLRIKDEANKRPLSHGSVNRELVVLRRLMKFAHGRGWIDRDVFVGAGVIDRDAEKARDRVLSDAEEELLLAFTS